MLMKKMFTFGMFATNCFVAYCSETHEAVVIDPGVGDPAEVDELTAFISRNKLQVKFIVNTHGHPDHSCGNREVKKAFDAPICVHEADAYMLGDSGRDTATYFGYDCVSPPADVLLHDGDSVKFGNCALKVVHCPGHSAGSIVLVGEKEVFTGDTLFAGSIGRTDFPGSSERDMQVSLQKLKGFSDYFVVFPGHGTVSSMGVEKQSNPFLV